MSIDSVVDFLLILLWRQVGCGRARRLLEMGQAVGRARISTGAKVTDAIVPKMTGGSKHVSPLTSYRPCVYVLRDLFSNHHVLVIAASSVPVNSQATAP